MPDNKDMICINVRFSREEHRKLKVKAAILGKSLSELARIGLRKEIRFREKKS